jgi:hypothetical protein
MLLNKNHVVLLTTTYLMLLIESKLGQYIGWEEMVDNFTTNTYWLSNDILHYYKDEKIYNYILMYLSILNTNIMLMYLNVFYVYIGILNITGDIDVIVDFHILYGLIVLSLKYEYILIEFSSKTILGICGCLYIRKVLYKLYKLYLN